MTVRIPVTAEMLDAYGFCIEGEDKLRDLSNGQNLPSVSYWLNSAVIHQETPWPVTGVVLEYISQLVIEDGLPQAAAADITELLATAIRVTEHLAQHVTTEVTVNLDHFTAPLLALPRSEQDLQLEELYEDEEFIAALGAATLHGLAKADPAVRRALNHLLASGAR